MDSWLTIREIVESAVEVLDRDVWDYSSGGADGEVTLRRNRTAFDLLAFSPRVLRGSSENNVSATLLEHELDIPILFAPIGSITQFHSDGALACARVAERVGTASFVGTLASPSLEEVRAATSCPLFFQLYLYGDREWTTDLVRRVENAGYDAICLTVDVASYGRRERDLRNRFSPREAVARPNLGPEPTAKTLVLQDDYNARFSWDDLAWLRDVANLPIMVKGVLSREDAITAVDYGVDVVYVSNHGGRQLDHTPAAIEVLPEITDAVSGRAEIVIDSGFMRGTDVVKALALGADTVAIGRLMIWALACGAERGLQRAVELLKEEMTVTMANLGASSLKDLSPRMLRPATRPAEAPWPVCVRPACHYDSTKTEIKPATNQPSGR